MLKDILYRKNTLAMVVVLVVLLMIIAFQALFSWRSINGELSNRQRIETNVKNDRIESLKNEVANIIDNSAPAFEQQLAYPDQMRPLLLNMMRKNPELLGCAVAFVPGYYEEKGRLFSPYAYREDTLLRTKLLTYDYTDFEWYRNVVVNGQKGWCKPYADQDGTYALMSTYSIPLYDDSHRVVAVLTGDLPMSDLTPLEMNDQNVASMRSVIILCLQVLVLLFVAFLAWYTYMNIKLAKAATADKKCFSDELNVALTVQKSLLPTRKVQHQHVSVVASLIPAPKVSGDIYDYEIKGDTLYFCIGDMASSGMGATMAMTIASTAFRTSIVDDDEPAQTMRKINKALMRIEERQMFGTFFVGKLNMQTGSLTSCNGGHFLPIIISSDGLSSLDVVPNVPLGLKEWNFEQQTTQLHLGDMLFLYTDGILESTNGQQQAFGDKRLMLHLKSLSQSAKTPEQIVQHLTTVVGRHQGEDSIANDDLTMMVVSFS